MPANPLNVPSRQVGAAALLIAMAILVSTGLAHWQSYHRTEERVGRSTRNLARLLAEHAGQTLGGIEETLRAVGRLRQDVARGIYRSQASIYVHLNTLRSGSPALTEVGWFDPYGQRVATSRELDPAPLNAADAELFRVPSRQSDGGVRVAAPIADGAGRREVGVSLRLENLDGSFAGVAGGTVDPASFVELVETLELADGYSVALLREDGAVLARAPASRAAGNAGWISRDIFDVHLPRSERGTYDSAGHIASYAVVPRSASRLAIVAGAERAAAFAEFRRDLVVAVMETALGLTVLLLGARLIVGGLRRREELQLALAESTERARMARAEAEAANHAKSAFLARMSHELRTPLNAVLGFGQMLELDRAHPLSPRQREYCGYILQSGRHLLELISEVLDFAGIEAGRLSLAQERIGTAEAIDNIAAIMQPVAAKAGVELTVVDAAGVPDLRADTLRLRQVLINLLANAIKYNHRGGRVMLSAAPVRGGGVRLAVADTGPGIAADRQADLFRPFERLGAEGTAVEGTGLGLALSKRLVEAMGGSIGFMSEPGRGSTFWVDLPAAGTPHPDAAVPHPDGAVDAAHDGRSLRR